MKQIFIFICSSLLLFSCKKHCNSVQKNLLRGKLKEYVSYVSETDSINQVGRYHFKYDSITGELNDVIASVKISGGNYVDSFITIQISKKDATHLLLTYNDVYHFEPERYIVYHLGKQIISISLIDTVGTEIEVTHCYTTNDILDSIHDNGSFPSKSITLNQFNYANGNCVKYSSSWNELYPNPVPVYKSTTDTFVYNGFINTKVASEQITGFCGFSYYSTFSYLSKIIYYLSIDGYYAVKPNKNLVDSIYSGGLYYKFNYEFNDDNLVKCKINRNTSSSIAEFSYY
jgi:hypothetical protein